jgi:isopenicillin N synthase-like dioxygenase
VSAIPVIDLRDFERGGARVGAAARELDAACREHGFFGVVGHGVDPELFVRLDAEARAFFALDASEKAEIAMPRGGRAWRGWFPPGGELTSGVPDGKEGIYFGAELPADDPRVRAGRPLHGANLFPRRPAALRETVLTVIGELTALGHRIMRALALGLGLDAGSFARAVTADPVVLFRIFHYPPVEADEAAIETAEWGVAEHTDYGLLTILGQDDTGGLEVRAPSGWMRVTPARGALVCNLGDMLERMTGGRYRSTPHRVRRPAGRARVAFPFFFDPGWDVALEALPLAPATRPVAAAGGRWDGADVHALTGTYGEYLLAKVSRVFPELFDRVVPGA